MPDVSLPNARLSGVKSPAIERPKNELRDISEPTEAITTVRTAMSLMKGQSTFSYQLSLAC